MQTITDKPFIVLTEYEMELSRTTVKIWFRPTEIHAAQYKDVDNSLLL